MAGRAIGQMFAGLTLANVLGVPVGAWIGIHSDWQTTFLVIAALGVLATAAMAVSLPRSRRDEMPPSISMRTQLAAFRNPQLRTGLLITMLTWVGFMTFYGYIEPIAEHVAGFGRSALTGALVVVGLGLVIGNSLGGRTADRNLRLSLIGWPAAMIVSLIVVGLVAPHKWAFLAASLGFGIASFANVPPLQMRVMKHGGAAPELAATANISAFNIANALGGVIGGWVVDSHFGAGAIPFAAALVPTIGLLFILSRLRPARSARTNAPSFAP
jgi:DHA1 family inner membrane transport protein